MHKAIIQALVSIGTVYRSGVLCRISPIDLEAVFAVMHDLGYPKQNANHLLRREVSLILKTKQHSY